MIHYLTPWDNYSLGRAYNKACEIVPTKDWVCLLDGDTMFLNFDWGRIIEGHVDKIERENLNYGALTCYASRIGGKAQRYLGQISEDCSLINHRKIALENEKKNRGLLLDITSTKFISGHLILFRKITWERIRFSEETSAGRFLGIDNVFFNDVRKSGLKIGLMADLYLLHYYRLLEGRSNKSHLI